jgi:hypothetical protein
MIGVSIFFIIVRGIEFGDLKTQKWLTSILTGFFSSILFTQPVKVYFGFFNLNEFLKIFYCRLFVSQYFLLVSVETPMMIKKQVNLSMKIKLI